MKQQLLNPLHSKYLRANRDDAWFAVSDPFWASTRRVIRTVSWQFDVLVHWDPTFGPWSLRTKFPRTLLANRDLHTQTMLRGKGASKRKVRRWLATKQGYINTMASTWWNKLSLSDCLYEYRFSRDLKLYYLIIGQTRHRILSCLRKLWSDVQRSTTV